MHTTYMCAQDKRKKLQRIQAVRVEAPTDLETVEDRPPLHFPRPTFCERDMIQLKDASWGYVCVCVCVCVCVRIQIYVYIYIYVYINICIYVYMYIYMCT